MPDAPQSSEQLQNLTTSQDGTSRVPRLQPESHFFIQGGGTEGDFNQSASFGAISETQFRTTTTLTFTGQQKDLYALCMGTVFLQPQSGTENSSKVNLILKPYKQPINGLNIKYIIYRGLNKADFITNDGKIAGSETSGSGFVRYVWAQFNKFYEVANGGVLPETGFKSEFIGYPYASEQLNLQENSHLIDQYFFKVAPVIVDENEEEDPATAFELPIIPRGIQLGAATDTIGIDVVLNDGDYIIENDSHPFQLNLEYARASSFLLDTTSETDLFRKKLIKETATKFLDIVAFYGLHANGAGKLYVDTATTPLTTKIEIALRLQNFTTKNNFYLYIQSNRQRSYHFYGNYTHSDGNSNTIKIGTTETNMTETTFGTLGWPVHIVNEVQDPSNENNTVVFHLTTDNHDGAALFSQIGELASVHEENFVRGINLLQEPSNDENVIVDVNYTKPIGITTPALDGITIASFSQLIYEGKRTVVKEVLNQDQNIFLKDIDDVFGLINIQPLFANNNSFISTVVDNNSQIINFKTNSSKTNIGVIKHQKTQDRIPTIDDQTFVDRVTYETLSINVKLNNPPHLKPTTTHLGDSKKSFKNLDSGLNNKYKLQSPYYFSFALFSDGNALVTGVKLSEENGGTPIKKVLGITEGEQELINTIQSSLNLSNAKIYFKETLSNQNDVYISVEGITYKTFLLSVVGENESGSIFVYDLSDEIKVYTIDDFVFFTKLYSEYMTVEIVRDNSNLIQLEN